MTSSNTCPFGLFGYVVATDSWWWSDSVYELYGFTPGEIVPTTELILSHKHPEDVAEAREVMRRAMSEGQDFAMWHRLVDAQRRIRQVVTVGSGVRAPGGALAEVRGFIIDLTDAQRRSAAAEVDEAVRASAETRGLIEQVKGALMLSYGLDANDAFDLLRQYSQLTNVKVREVARLLASVIARSGRWPEAAQQMFEELLAGTVSSNGDGSRPAAHGMDGPGPAAQGMDGAGRLAHGIDGARPATHGVDGNGAAARGVDGTGAAARAQTDPDDDAATGAVPGA